MLKLSSASLRRKSLNRGRVRLLEELQVSNKGVPVKPSADELNRAGQDPMLGAMKRAAVRAGRATGNKSLLRWGVDLVKPPKAPELGNLGKQKPPVSAKE
jgi:hypothetical protein